MDEIVDLKELQKLQTIGHSRTSNKCYRCKQKRIRCDFTFPKCSNCESSGTDCSTWIKGIKGPLPRSLLLHLEDRVAQLEIQLQKLKQHHSIDDSEEHAYNLTKAAATPWLKAYEISESSADSCQFFNLLFNSSSLPPPFDSTIGHGQKGTMKQFIESNPPVDLYSIPGEVVNFQASL
ncbi:unnamed protein product [Ambrosiozyma monospora]|uniref:Unnamed protein product n=1 Tax=Ambrosiozyma monospora TaxID=43982 RepID=A0ACB5TAL8_AMBMO|nr:unnamed protein product [Ambrosiozyma monospora]